MTVQKYPTDPYFFVVPVGDPATSWNILDTRTQTVVNTVLTTWADARDDAIARNKAVQGN